MATRFCRNPRRFRPMHYRTSTTAPSFAPTPQEVRNALNVVRNHGRYYLREWAEQTERVRQVIPCVIVRNGTRLLCVRRAKKGREDPAPPLHLALRRPRRRGRLDG